MSETTPERPRPGEVPLKRWIHEQAEKLGISPRAAEARFLRGRLGSPVLRRVTKRTIFVQVGVK